MQKVRAENSRKQKNCNKFNRTLFEKKSCDVYNTYISGGCTHYIEYLNRHCTVRTENSVKDFADEDKAELERIEVVVRISAVKIAVVKTAVIVE